MSNRFLEIEESERAKTGAPAPSPSLSDGPAPVNRFADDPAAAKPYVEPPPSQTVYKSGILPLSKDAQGNVSFDLSAGIPGALGRAFTLPGRVQSGETKVDPADPAFIGETLNFAGSFGPAVNPAIRSGDRVIPGAVRNPAVAQASQVPSREALLDAGGKQIDKYQKAPVRYNPAYAPTVAQQIETALIKDGVLHEDAPGLFAALARMRANQGPPGSQVVFEPGNLISIRKNIVEKFGRQGESQHGVGIALKHIDDFIANPPAGAVLAGPAAAAGEIYKRGLGNYAAGMRAAELELIKRTADLRTGAAYSGLNADNTLRSRIASHVLNAKKVRGYTDPEVAMLETIPTGSRTTNVIRQAGNVLGGGGGVVGTGMAGGAAYGLGSLFGLGPAAAGAAAVAAPIAGQLLRREAGRRTAGALDEASQVLRQRSPLFREQPWAYGAPRDPARDAMARTLMQMESQVGQGVPVDQPTTLEELEARGVPRITVTPRS